VSTEEQILEEARKIFYKKGLAGARMQEIADNAGINKAMLHYYFKTKDQLFNKVFSQAFEAFAGKIAEVLNSDEKLDRKIIDYVNHTVDALMQNPGLPVFVLNELTFNPERLTELFAGKDKVELTKFRQQVEKQTQGATDADALFIDMVALCVYPFVVAPVFKRMLQKTDDQYKAMLLKRKRQIINELLKRV
jgi:TetR/AcrR family transcriptional regulator